MLDSDTNSSRSLGSSNVSIMIKPVGALCNLDCTYCYYLPTKTVYDGHEHRMKLDTLESIFAGFLPDAAKEVTVCWQGGEPTLAGLAFFKRAVELQDQYKRADQTIANSLQTNGTLLTEEWCEFLRANRFLVGLSIDGPEHFHDHYRKTNAGDETHFKVRHAFDLLNQGKVEYNLLCVLNDRNVKRPDDVFNYLLNLGSRWLQFIPAIEWEADADKPGENRLAAYSPSPADYGQFLCRVFDLWFERYRQRVSVRIFDAVLNKLVLNQMPLCILDRSCHGQMTIEHSGDVFGCDHFIERRWQLGKIGDESWSQDCSASGDQLVSLTIHGTGYQPNAEHAGRDIAGHDDLADRYTLNDENRDIDRDWIDRGDGDRLATFAARKLDLPAKCESCKWKPLCHGGCPKHRSHGGDVPEPTVLCESYMKFYEHVMPRMEWLAGYFKQGKQPPPVDADTAGQAASDPASGGRRRPSSSASVKRNDPCPCGSGLKYKKCCGRGR